ncbi:MAG: restriction endonuclease [Candidatus Bathyarchaeia archaeon]|jgi:restriction system protein
MADDQIKVGYKRQRISASGNRVLSYFVEMSHEGLNEHKIISAPDQYMLENKINIQKAKWREKWDIVSCRREVNQEKEANIDEAIKRTQDAVNAQNTVENILLDSLSINNAVNWEKLKKKEHYTEPMPIKPCRQVKKTYPNKPVEEEPTFSFTEKMFKSKMELKIKEFETRYSTALSNWEKEKASVDQYNLELDLDYEKQLKTWENDVSQWEERKKAFLKKQEEFNAGIDLQKQKYLSKDPGSIYEYFDMVLNNSKYPESFPSNFEVEYNPENKMLIIEYELPSQSDVPALKEVKYIAARKELKETLIPDNQINKMYDEIIYKITLRTIHELFESDVINVIDAISFNGWVNSINKATGKEENNCILSIQAKKEEFMNIDLKNVDPKTCFKTLKGVAASKLSTLTPVQPILQMSREDHRFVDSYEVENKIDNSTNLAAMDWEDFENLIRELFEKEFQANGGEVKITQASRDGGVDAVAFDPDPIRGGKIVIQAKRYTNTVGVSAVRDLFGTVMNEGATKGILVTTSDYGSDSYNFAKGKPITLLNGSNLLSLLEKHGHHAKIDIRDAKRILNEDKT